MTVSSTKVGKPTLVIGCPPGCSFHPDRIGHGLAEALMLVRANGAGIGVFKKRAEELLKRPVPASNVQRHMAHYREMETIEKEVTQGRKLADLEILDLVIQRGAANSTTWKPTIKDTIEAMKLKMQMTGNSAFDDLIALFDGVEADEAMPEAPEAILAEDERPDEPDEPEDPVL